MQPISGGYKEVFAVTWVGCVLLCAQIVFAQAVSQTHHRHHLEVLQGQSVEPDTGCGYTGSKVIFTALYGTTVRTPWLNCAVESAMLKRGNDSVIVLTDSIEQFKESWPGSLPSPARLVDVPSCLTNTPLQHWLESPELAAAVFRQQNIANALRLAAIYKNGGVYLDLDIIPLQDKVFLAEGALSMQCTIAECGEDFWLNNAYLNFPPKHPFMWQLMNAFALEFNGALWGFNGPRLVSSLYNRLLCADLVAPRSECAGVDLLPVERLAPLNWANTIQALSSSPAQAEFDFHNEDFWAVHVYHNMWKSACIPQPSVFNDIMLEHCPQVSMYSSNHIYCQVLM
ncbi:TPA: Lactosylceramide 4-alpha-galactosyltransferase [Trebouxia sp. C0006]